MRVKRSTLLTVLCVFTDPPQMLCGPTQTLLVREEFSVGCASRKINTSLYLPDYPIYKQSPTVPSGPIDERSPETEIALAQFGPSHLF